MNGDHGTGSNSSGGFRIRKERLLEGISEQDIASMCELRRIAGALECRREGDFLVTKWPIVQTAHENPPK